MQTIYAYISVLHLVYLRGEKKTYLVLTKYMNHPLHPSEKKYLCQSFL